MNNEPLFHEIYGVYYQAVSEIINKAISTPLNEMEIQDIISRYAFRESSFLLSNAIGNDKYNPVLYKNHDTRQYETSIKNKPQLPLSLLEKKWLKTISEDPRIKLFDYKFPNLEGITPLYDKNDIYYCGQYYQGDDYSSEKYISCFKTVFKSVKENRLIYIKYLSPTDGIIEDTFEPHYLQYSTKENKFRLLAFPFGTDMIYAINISRIIDCSIKEKVINPANAHKDYSYVELLLKHKRESLERLLLYFSNYERHSKKIDDDHFLVTIFFPRVDEKEVFINILSFIPMVKIISPEQMKEKFIERIKQQNDILKSRKM